MPAAVPADERLDVPLLTRVTRGKRADLQREADRRGITVAALQREYLDAGLVRTAAR